MDKNKKLREGTCIECKHTLGFAPDLSLAMAYVPDQPWEKLCDLETGFMRGTIFEQLYKPWRY